MAKDLYEPEIVAETPFPQEEVQSVTQTQGTSTVATPTTTKEKNFPTRKIATELMSTALNTKSKKILQEFELQQSGGLKIGDYKDGITGDLRLTPNGLTARDKAGLTTFAIDGITGDAVFKGTIQSGSLLTGGITVEDENGTTIIDGLGLISSANFISGSYQAYNTVSIKNTFSATDVDGSTLSFTLPRETKVLVTFYANVWISSIDTFRAYYIKVGTSVNGSTTFANGQDYAQFDIEGVAVAMSSCLSLSKIFTLPAGVNTIKMQWAGFSDTFMELRTRGLTYCILGT
jgi:hypothetical protein